MSEKLPGAGPAVIDQNIGRRKRGEQPPLAIRGRDIAATAITSPRALSRNAGRLRSSFAGSRPFTTTFTALLRQRLRAGEAEPLA